jgi:hypothetical protein
MTEDQTPIAKTAFEVCTMRIARVAYIQAMSTTLDAKVTLETEVNPEGKSLLIRISIPKKVKKPEVLVQFKDDLKKGKVEKLAKDAEISFKAERQFEKIPARSLEDTLKDLVLATREKLRIESSAQGTQLPSPSAKDQPSVPGKEGRGGAEV